MNKNEPNHKPFYERPLIVIPAIFAIIIILILYNRIGDSAVNERSQTSEVVKEDSIQTVDGLVPESNFETAYSAERWYEEFSSNKVAFAQKYEDKQLDVYGTIGDITSDYGCSIVNIRAGDSGLDQIVCSNCPENSDKWIGEVTNLTVGEQVHIRGKYGGTDAYDYKMLIYKAHVLTP